MPREKKVVQDIVPTNKRTIRTVAPASKRIPVEQEEVEEEGVEEVPIRRATPLVSISRAQTRMAPPPLRRPSRPASAPRSRKRFPSILLTFGIIFISIAIIAIALSLLYSKAAVTITPKTANVDINGTFTAKKMGDATVTSSGLVYETVSATQTLSQSVPAKEGALIENKAKGSVTLYNEQTTQQKIVAGTRLSNADGDVYRTTATIVIPPGKEGAPGSIVAAVLADAVGAQYNMSLAGATDLKVVAYKGTPKYETVYAKLKTAITGGFAGKKTTIAPEVQTATTNALKESLVTKLLEEAKKLAPKDSVIYTNAYTIEYEIPEPVSKGGEAAEISLKGTLTAAVFRKTAFVKSIAARELDKFPAPSYSINGLEALKFTVVNPKDFSAKKGTPLIFTLKGPVNLIGTFSESALKEELKGTYLKDSNEIFAKYPSIANAYALITPFWMRSFPNAPEKIIIEIKK